MERHRGWHQRVVADARGQSTVEYAVVLGALVCVAVALGTLAATVSDGTFAQHAVMAASHNIQGSAGGVIDVFCF